MKAQGWAKAGKIWREVWGSVESHRCRGHSQRTGEGKVKEGFPLDSPLKSYLPVCYPQKKNLP